MSSDSAEVHNEISGTTQTGLQFRDAHGPININTPGERPAAPWQAPPHVGPFVDRAADLEQLRSRLLGTRDTTVTVLDGVRGIGKTALLRVAAAQFGDQFPGGVFHVPFAEDPTSSSVHSDYWVTVLLQSLGVADANIPSNLETRKNHYVSRTRELGRPMLLLVEGATHPAQVRPLIPAAPGSAILVAADGPALDELDVDGAVPHPLSPLSFEAARELLHALCDPPMDTTSTDWLIHACAGLPLALVMVAARLRRGSAPEALAAQLAEHRSHLAGIGASDRLTLESVFADSYAQLSASAAQLYRALGRWPGARCEPGLAAALAGADSPTAQRALTELREANLVEADPAGQVRFRHHLIRVHARERDRATATHTDRVEGLRRGLDHYRALLGHADHTLSPVRLRCTDLTHICAGVADPFDGQREHALDFLHTQRETLPAVVRTAVEAGCDEHAWQCAELATALYLTVRYIHDWADTGQLGAQAARRCGNADAEARLRSLTSRPLLDLGKREQAGQDLETARALVTDSTSLLLHASVAELHGRYLAIDDHAAAIAAFDQAWELNKRAAATTEPTQAANAQRAVALVAYFRARTLDSAGQHEAAIAELSAAVTRFEELTPPDTRMAARARASLGRAHRNGAELATAARELGAAVQVLQEQNLVDYEAHARQDLGVVLGALDMFQPAREHLERALALFEQVGSPQTQEVQRQLDELDTQRAR